MKHLALIFAAVALMASPLRAEPPDLASLARAVQELRGTLSSQQERIAALEAENVRLRGAATLNTPPTTPPAVPMAARSGNAFNPEIGLVGDIVGQLSESEEDEEGNDRISVRELELTLGADVDPYSRFDSTIAFSDFEEVHLEEAYLTRFDLPLDLTARLGRFRPRIDRAASIHRESLPTVDEPLVVQEYLGVEGFSRSGIELSTLLPLPWEEVAHEVTFGLLEGGNGEGGTLFGENRRRPTWYGRLRNSADLSDMTSLDLGTTLMLGSADDDAGYETGVLEADLVFTHFVTPQNRFRFEVEGFVQDRDAPAVEGGHGHGDDEHAAEDHGDEEHEEEEHEDEGLDDLTTPFRENPWGMYAVADYHLSANYSVGARWDYVEPANREETMLRSADTAWSVMATWFQSEFARWRFQYQLYEPAEGGNDHRFFLQGVFAIGIHRHPLD